MNRTKAFQTAIHAVTLFAAAWFLWKNDLRNATSCLIIAILVKPEK